MGCRNCERDTLERVLDLGLQPWGNDFIPLAANQSAKRYPLELFFCHHCAMVQIGHTVPKETMFRNHNYLSGTTRSLADHFAKVAAQIMSRTLFTKDEYILDIGGNDGTFLRPFAEKDIKVINVDSGRTQAEVSTRSGIFCVNEFFNESLAKKIRDEHGPAKVIHGSGILFHLEELHSTFRGIQHLLSEDGVLVAEFISLPEMVEKCAFDQIYHEHLLYYNLTTFARLLARHGLEPFDCRLSPIHGGSCIVSVGHRGKFLQTPAIQARLNWEQKAGFVGIDIYKTFAKRVEVLRDKLRTLVHDLRKKDLSIHTLGAPVKGSTIVNYCGWTEKDIACATEINDLKVNTYVPGTRIPVVHQNKSPWPDVYMLLSWNFREEILSRLNPFLESGRKILVPIPSPELLTAA